jgi:hypothetical protein
VIDVPARHAFDQLEDRAVVMRVAARGDELLGDLLERSLGVDRLSGPSALSVTHVADNPSSGLTV